MHSYNFHKQFYSSSIISQSFKESIVVLKHGFPGLESLHFLFIKIKIADK